MLTILDYLITLVHLGVIFFNMFGWLHPKTRRAHLICMALTLISWLGFGIFYGLGYCFLTDWHYIILNKLGYRDLPMSFITFAIERLLGLSIDDVLVIEWTYYTMIFIVVSTIIVNLKTYLCQSKTI